MSLIFATQLTTVATVALAVLALVAGVLAGLAFWRQSQEVGLLLEQNKRDTDERRRAQAARVYLGPPPDEGVPIPYAVVNASDMPVYYAEIWYWESGNVTGPDTLGIIMPGQPPNPGRALPSRDELKGAFLTFRDAQGIYWIRTPAGEIREARHYSAEDDVRELATTRSNPLRIPRHA